MLFGNNKKKYISNWKHLGTTITKMKIPECSIIHLQSNLQAFKAKKHIYSLILGTLKNVWEQIGITTIPKLMPQMLHYSFTKRFISLYSYYFFFWELRRRNKKTIKSSKKANIRTGKSFIKIFIPSYSKYPECFIMHLQRHYEAIGAINLGILQLPNHPSGNPKITANNG